METVKEEVIHEAELIVPEVSDKVTAHLTPFLPTEAQERFLESALKPGVEPTWEAWAKDSDIPKRNVTLWRRDERFVEWFIRQFQLNMEFYKAEWMAIGIRKMASDFKHWERMFQVFFPSGMDYGKGPVGSRKGLEEMVIKMLGASVKIRNKEE